MDAPCRIRPAEPSDLPAVATIERGVFADPWPIRAFRQHLADRFLVAVRADTVRGYVVTRVTVDSGEILNLAVDPATRREGIGAALVRAALRDLEAHGVVAVYLEVRESNRAARELYAREGFRAVGRRPGYYRKPPEDAVLMARGTGSA